MKKLVFSSLLILIVIMGYACQNKKSSEDVQQQDEVVKTTVDSVVMMAGSPEVLTSVNDTIKVTIVNNTSLEATTGEYFQIEQYIQDHDIIGWETVPLELFFIDIAYILQPGGSKEFKISLHPESYKYKSGKYRITKRASTEEGSYDLSFNFELKL